MTAICSSLSILRSLVLVAALTALAGCTTAPAKPKPFTLTLDATADLNPGPDGAASPVVVRVYQLASDGDFRTASFGSLYPGDGRAALSKNLIAQQELMSFPGEKTNVEVSLSSDARVLGILVAYRDIDHASWRLVCAVKSGSLRVALSKNAATARGCS